MLLRLRSPGLPGTPGSAPLSASAETTSALRATRGQVRWNEARNCGLEGESIEQFKIAIGLGSNTAAKGRFALASLVGGFQLRRGLARYFWPDGA